MATITYKCPSCDGPLQFEPEQGNFFCPYCLNRFTPEEVATHNPDVAQDTRGPRLSSAKPEGQEAWVDPAYLPHAADDKPPRRVPQTSADPEEALLYHCPSCGAEIVTDTTTAATTCYYCHNPVVLQGRLDGAFLPRAIIPFSVSREQAVEQFRQWVSSKRFVPKDFYSEKQIELLSGVYFPYWVVDVEVDQRLSATGVNTSSWRAGDTVYTENKYYSIERQGTALLPDITKNALQKVNRQLVEAVQPFDQSKAIPFSMPYLAGFNAEKRDMEKEVFADEVRREALTYADALMESTVQGYAAVTGKRVQQDIRKAAWDYTLLPVWVLTYKVLSGKPYYYAMNGQTGKVAGELPLDKAKLALTAVATGLAIFGAGILGSYFLW